MQYSMRSLLVTVATFGAALGLSARAGIQVQATLAAGICGVWLGMALCVWGVSAFYRRRLISFLAVLAGCLLLVSAVNATSFAIAVAISRAMAVSF